MSDARLDITTTRFMLPPDAKFLPVSDLSPRLRAGIGPVEVGQSVITRPGFRVTTRLLPRPLTDLIAEFHTPSLLTDAVLRFARAHEQDPSAVLTASFDALATLVEARILVAPESPDASAPAPSLAAGQEFAGYEIGALIRSLEDSEVYRAHGRKGVSAALKIVRHDRSHVASMIANEARVLKRLGGEDSPSLLSDGTHGGRAYVAMEWCDGVSIAIAAQRARSARDRRQLQDLVSRMFATYDRLHRKGLLHGDIHPSNILVRDDGRIVILDFGYARSIDVAASVDAMRSGLPQFYDPQMAREVLAGRLPPAATTSSEQYAIAVLAYLLLTGLQPLDSPTVHDELLRRIIQRPPLPFAARGVQAWPEIEAVVARALAKQPADRFPDVASLACAFSQVGASPHPPPLCPPPVQCKLETAVEAVRSLSMRPNLPHVWFALRAALALEDSELLAAADILVCRARPSWVVQSVAVLVARARSDSRMESRAIVGFLAAAERLPDGQQVCRAILAAATILEGSVSRSLDSSAALADWAARRLDRLMLNQGSNELNAASIVHPVLTYVALSLVKTGAVAVPCDLRARLEALMERDAGNVWLWALAHEVFADSRFKALGLTARIPNKPLKRGFALLRRHQLSGDLRWVADANRILARESSVTLPPLDTALLLLELKAPERAILPPFLFPCASRRFRSDIATQGRASPPRHPNGPAGGLELRRTP